MPQVLIGVSGQPGLFTTDVVEAMAAIDDIIGDRMWRPGYQLEETGA